MAEIHDDMATEKADHETELQALERPTIQAGASTPWGMAQVSRQYADDIVLHSTASHGGFHLAENANSAVHALFRNDGEFYEEDCEWAKVAHAFPHLFTTYERRLADRTLRDYFPDAYERVTGAILNGGQSHMRDRQEFESVHRNDWVVIAALNSDQQPGFVECIATLGGIRGEVGERRFLVPRSDYSIGRHGFVIDPVKHESYDGPSSFVTWAARHTVAFTNSSASRNQMIDVTELYRRIWARQRDCRSRRAELTRQTKARWKCKHGMAHHLLLHAYQRSRVRAESPAKVRVR